MIKIYNRLHFLIALNPIIWLCSISTPFCLTGAYVFRNTPTIPTILIITAILPIGTACISLTMLFSFFAKFFPENLFSENNQLHHNDSTKKSQNLDPNSKSQLGDKTLNKMSLKDAIDKLHDLNRIDLNELNLKHTRPWQIWSISTTVIITVFSLFSYFIAPELKSK